jgi:hypothetical protein
VANELKEWFVEMIPLLNGLEINESILLDSHCATHTAIIVADVLTAL